MFIEICSLCSKKVLRTPTALRYFNIRNITSLATKRNISEGHIVISCKRKEYNHYSDSTYNKFDEVVLASKGWNHNKAKGDHFTVLPNTDVLEESSRTPLTETEIDSNLVKCLHTQNITEATSFQNEAISVISKGPHALLAAETGCGKTLAYLLPILNKLIGGKPERMNAPRALVLLPNRELAHQVASVASSLADSIGLKVKVIIGGRTKKIMLNPEFSEVDLLVGTPGALGKLSNTGVYRLNNVLHTVLDEADTLIDDSFVDRLTGIIKRVSQSQLVLVSATLPTKMPPILEPYEPNLVQVVSPLLHKPSHHITQKFIRLIRSAKPANILGIVKNTKEPLLVFANKNETCNWLSIFFTENGLKCARLNGNMHYADRIEQWNQFVTGQVKILIATDVGSRGLNTTQIKHVVNYDFPLYAADYLHRIGRTGRFGSPKACKVTNFISGSEEVRLVQKIELAIRRNEPIPNVDGNITRILQNKMLRKIREDGLM